MKTEEFIDKWIKKIDLKDQNDFTSDYYDMLCDQLNEKQKSLNAILDKIFKSKK